jgi:L-threonylcarbamoyladenylate synthase
MEVISPILQKAASAIKSGLILVCPTDTVYGLIADATNKKAVARIYQIKKRSKHKLLPLFVKDIRMAKKFYRINPAQEEFLKNNWPGPVTVVFKKGKPALRMPDDKFLLALMKRVGPLAETSANISGQPATTKVQEVIEYFKDQKYQPDIILNGGDLKSTKPSRVIDLTGSKPIILRK